MPFYRWNSEAETGNATDPTKLIQTVRMAPGFEPRPSVSDDQARLPLLDMKGAPQAPKCQVQKTQSSSQSWAVRFAFKKTPPSALSSEAGQAGGRGEKNPQVCIPMNPF